MAEVTPFLVAVEEGDVGRISALVEGGEDVNQLGSRRENALMRAAGDGNLAVVRFLIDAGADVDAAHWMGNTALINAVWRKGNLNVVKILVKCGVNVNISDSWGDTPLIYAARNGDLEVIKFLVEVGAQVDALGSKQRTALLCAIRNGHLNTARFLLENDAEIEAADCKGWTSLIHAVWIENEAIAQLLVEKKANVDTIDCSNLTPLMHAVLKDNLKISKFLVQNGANIQIVNNEGSTALIYAARNNNLEIIKFLVECGAYVNAVNNAKMTPLMYVLECGDMTAVRFLIESGADTKAVNLNNTVGNKKLDDVRSLVDSVDDTKTKNVTMLIDAIENGDLDFVRQHFGKDSDRNAVKDSDRNAANMFGRSLLFCAAERGILDIVRILIDHGADVNTRDRGADVNAADHDSTSLMVAAQEGNMDIVQHLVKHGADVNTVDRRECTAVLYASMGGYWDVVRFLVSSGADVNAVNIDDRSTALIYAAKQGQLETIRILVANGADVNAADCQNLTSVMFAAETENLRVVCFLIDSGAEIASLENKKIKLLMRTAESCDLKGVRLLLGDGSETNIVEVFGRTLLMCAAKTGRSDILQFLLESGADVNAVDRRYRTPVLHASENRHWDVVRFLVGKGANVNAIGKSGWTSLLYAVQESHLDIIQFLVDAGADVNTSTTNWPTSLLNAASGNNKRIPLIVATDKGVLEVVQFLVQRGADVNSVGSDGQTALMQAAEKGNFKTIEFLSQSGAEFDVADKNGKTVLMCAVMSGDLDALQFIYEKNSDVDVNAVDHNGWTSLMYGAQSGNLDVVKFLLDSGADVSIVNNNHRTAIFIASSRGYTDVEQLLMEYLPYTQATMGNPISQMPDNCFIPALDVKLQKFIGYENVGRKYRALWLDAEVVVKLFVPELYVTTFSHEVAAWHRLRHPHVLQLYGACDIGHNFFVCEWASNGSLVEHLAVWEKRGERRTPWKFLHQAALGLAYLHERKIMHGNLCNNSILVGGDGMVKLANFQVSGSATWEQSDVGCWQAPERLRGDATSIASDIYSLGLCIIATVTRETPWRGCLDDISKVRKANWNATADPVKYGPVDDMTDDLTLLASKMCGNDPASRVSVLAVVQMLEILAVQESREELHSTQKCKWEQRLQSTLEPNVCVSDFRDGDLIRMWQKLQYDASKLSTTVVNKSEHALFREAEKLFECLSAEHRPMALLDKFCKLIADCIGALDVASHQYRILRLSSPNAQGHSMTGIYRRIDAIWDAIDAIHAEEHKQRRKQQRLKQQEVFISELEQTLVVLNQFETDEDRCAIMNLVKSEIASHGSLYTASQFTILQNAYNDLETSLKSTAVSTMPEWFLPWYELEIDGANYVAEGAFGEVYRAKWLESEVIVKQVKLTNSTKLGSWAFHSLDASLSISDNVEQIRQEKRDMFVHEVGVWFGLSHPHVVRLFGACHVGTPLFVCEYASNGSLNQYLRKHPNEIWKKLYEAALGIQYLHSRDIIHGDLKCNNIVVGGDIKAKITDFGLSSANVVTGAWHWVAPECLEKEGSSKLSTATDIYAFGMCIVEALRIVETIKKKEYCVLPWGKFDNIQVKYLVTHLKKLPNRPKLCTDHEWGLVERMCAFDRSKRLKISTVVCELGALAGVDTSQTPEIAKPESVKISKEVDKMKSCCDFKAQDQREGSSSNQFVLRSVYGLLWDRFQDLCGMPTAEFGCLQRHFDRARLITQELSQCPNTLLDFTEMVMNGYALHRELDKAIDANFWYVDRTSGGLHDWKSKCINAVCTPGLDSTSKEMDEECREDVNERDSDGKTALMKAASNENLADIRHLIDAGADINAGDWEGNTVLMHAAWKKWSSMSNLDAIQLLVNCGADVNASNACGNTPLMRATMYGEMEVVRFLVKNDADVNSVNNSRWTPLLYAIEHNHRNVAQFLLENKADIEAANIRGHTPLMLATRSNDLEAVELLIKHNSDVNTVDVSKMTSLMYAVCEDNLEITTFLVKHGADIHGVDNERSAALNHAALKANVPIIEFLIESGADVDAVNKFGKTSLMTASGYRDLNTVQLFVKNGADVKAADIQHWTPAMFAAGNGKLDIVSYLVESGADANDLENSKVSMLMYAAESGNFDIIQNLQGSNSDFNVTDQDGRTLLMYAAKAGKISMVQLLVEYGADLNAADKDNWTPLLYASKNNHFDIVCFLVEQDADVNAVDKCGWTSLLLAAQGAHLDIIRFLVGKGADIQAATDNGSTALLYAVEKSYLNVVGYLVEAGGDINADDVNGRTPLIEAAHGKDLAIVQYLVHRGANVNNLDCGGRTALMHAAKKGNLSVIRFLIQSGANINVMDKTGWTSLMYAAQSGNLDAVQFFVDGGAEVNIVNKDGRSAIFIATSNGYTDIQRLLLQNISYVHHAKGDSLTQVPDTCFIPVFEVKLLQFTEHVGGDYRALWLDAEVVVKLFVPEASVTTFAHEVSVWHQLRHPNVIKLYGACDIGHHFFVCEWASSLVEHLNVCRKRGERIMPWKFLHEAALGLAYLHERKIVHGNLCSNSILVGSDGLVKLADFQVSGSTAISSGGVLDLSYGSCCWHAPERLKGEAASLASDIYSFCLCIITVLTGETPWGNDSDDQCKMNKERWDPKQDPHYCAPVIGMTFDLKQLASIMCSKDPHSRASASAVVRELEQLDAQKCKSEQRSQSILEPKVRVSEFRDGDLIRMWQRLKDVAPKLTATTVVNQPEHALFREAEKLFECLSAEHRPMALLDKFCKLIADCIGALDVASHQYQILRLSSTNAQGHSMTGIYRRIDAIWDAIDAIHAEEHKQRRKQHRLKQQEVFISELEQTLVVLNQFETDEDRCAIMNLVKSEIDSHGSFYTAPQLIILRNAYRDLNTSLKSTAVSTMPEWFLPWYELEIDGANYVAEGSFGEVYRAKWLESEVIVKQVKLTNATKLGSGAFHSLSASVSTNIQNIEQTRQDKRDMFVREVSVWFGLSHPHVVRLFGACHVGCHYLSASMRATGH